MMICKDRKIPTDALSMHWSLIQCCQVPVFVRIFTEIQPVIRSTETQWSIPQI